MFGRTSVAFDAADEQISRVQPNVACGLGNGGEWGIGVGGKLGVVEADDCQIFWRADSQQAGCTGDFACFVILRSEDRGRSVFPCQIIEIEVARLGGVALKDE